MGDLVIGIVFTILGFGILFFVIKGAVREGIKEAYGELNVYLRNLITNGINEANQPEKEPEAKKQEGEPHE